LAPAKALLSRRSPSWAPLAFAAANSVIRRWLVDDQTLLPGVVRPTMIVWAMEKINWRRLGISRGRTVMRGVSRRASPILLQARARADRVKTCRFYWKSGRTESPS
jgi:hypothetical protein